MYTLFEPGDLLNSPYEALLFDTAKHSFPIRAHWHHYMEIILMVEGTAIVESDEKIPSACWRYGSASTQVHSCHLPRDWQRRTSDLLCDQI